MENHISPPNSTRAKVSRVDPPIVGPRSPALPLILACVLLCGPAYAQERPQDQEDESLSTGWNPLADDANWKESESALPPFPQRKNLLPFEAGDLSNHNRYFVDKASLALGVDEVIRYTVVIQSETGLVNILHEGLRCLTREVKRYGFGTADGKMKRSQFDSWQRVRTRGMAAYQRELFNEYFCSDTRHPNPPARIIERLTDLHRLPMVEETIDRRS